MGKKQPASKNNPVLQKLPRHLEVYSDEKKVFWSFVLFDPEIELPEAGRPDLIFHDVATAIKHCEARTWVDIDANHKRDHPIEIHHLEKFAQDRLTQLQMDDLDVVWSIHIDGKFRIWGIRAASLMQILWIDPCHEICPSHKKHT